MSKKLLCLPGYLQNGKIFSEKSSGLRKLLTKKHGIQMDYIDPPIVIEEKEHLPFVLSMDQEEAASKWKGIVDLNVNRCWWQHKVPGHYEGFEQALDYVVNHIKTNGPYDGIIGFSQGAAMAAIVSNVLPSLLPLSLQTEEFSLAVFISGFVFVKPKSGDQDKDELMHSITDVQEYANKMVVEPEYEKYFTVNKNSTTQVINIFGSEDAAVPTIRSKHLDSLYTNSVSFEHDGGHYVPNKKQFLMPIVDKIVETLSKSPRDSKV